MRESDLRETRAAPHDGSRCPGRAIGLLARLAVALPRLKWMGKDRSRAVLFSLALLIATGFGTDGVAHAQSAPPGSCGPGAAGATCDGSGPASQGAAAPTEQGVGNPIHLMTGNKYQRDSDLPALPGVLGVEIVRHYNSAFSQIHHPVRAAGRGWRFSYETELYRVGATLQIVQADGTRLIFARPRSQRAPVAGGAGRSPHAAVGEGQVTEVCSTPDPAQGHLEILATVQGEAYVWRWPSGRRLDFDARLRLVRIEEPTGERLHLEHDGRGRLSRVVDPMGRALRFGYDGDSPLVSEIDSPLGRFSYEYGGFRDESLVTVTRDGIDGARIVRRYHHQDARFPAFLTAIDDEVRAGVGERAGREDLDTLQRRRVARFEYDRQARAVMSESQPEDDPAPGQIEVAGADAGREGGPDAGREAGREADADRAGSSARAPEGLVRTAERLRLEFARPALPTGGEGLTRVTNALGEITQYRFAIIAGHHRLLAAEGPGCQRCGPGNVRYRYDRLGRLIETTWLGQDQRPFAGERRRLDGQGRLLRLERIDYSEGQELRAVWLVRHEYADQRDAGSGPGVGAGVDRGAGSQGGRGRVMSIIRPSVIPGREARVEIESNERGQVSRIEEAGWSPGIEAGRAAPLARQQRLRYAQIGGRSLLVEIDGPLDNGPLGTPEDSDVQRFDYDSRGRLTEVWLPGDRRRRFAHDEAGLLVEAMEIDGDRRSRVRIERGGTALVRRILHAAWREPGSGQIDPGSVLEQVLEPEYDAFERQVAVRVDGRRERRVELDTASRPVRIIHADGGTMEIEYGPENRIAALTRRPVGAPGQRIAFTHRAGIVHDGMTLATMADESGLLHAFEADESGRRLQRRVDAAGQATTWEARSLPTGALVTRRSPGPMTLRYDLGGDLVEVSAPQAPGAVIGQALHAGTGLMQAGLDDFGRRVSFHSPAHGWVRQVWDPADRLIGVVDERLNARRIDRDLRGRAVRIQGADPTEIVHLEYHGPDLVSRRLERLRPAGSGGAAVLEEVRHYRHDAFGRLIGERRETEALDQPGRSWSLTIVYGYEGNSRRVNSRRLRDARGRIHLFEHGFHEDGSPAFVRFNGRTIVDQVRIASLTGLVSMRHGNGLVETFARTGRNRLKSIEVAAAGPPLARLEFAYDTIDRLQSTVERGPWGDRHRAYRYTPEGRPVEEEGSAVDRRVRGGAALTPVGWTPGDRAAASPGPAYPGRLDNAMTGGSRRGSGPWHVQAAARLRIDERGQLAIASLGAGGRVGMLRRPDGSMVSRYAYGLDGERLARQVGTDLRYAIHQNGPHGPRLEAEADRHGAIVAHYVYVDGLPVARIIVPGEGVDSGAEFAPQGLLERLHGLARRVLPADWPLPIPGAMRIYAIHCDQRSAPYMVTDESRRPIWLGRSDIRGRTEVELRTDKPFRMDLRLAGQFFDEESGVHAQHRRDYDPGTGRFLSPDPLSTQAGLSLATVLRLSGTDPTLYSGGDPLTRSDPSGLYEEDVHYYVTYFLALAAGLPASQARLIALGNRYIDDNPYTEPFRNYDARQRFHFTTQGYDPPRLPGETDAEYAARRYLNPSNPSLDELRALALGTPDPCARAFLYGEYGHAFMDSFAHRDQNNAPYNALTGHLIAGHSPDRTYNHTDAVYWTDISGATHLIQTDWRVNADRTLAMEEAFFNELQLDFGTQAVDRNGNPIRWEDIREVLMRFNAQEMDEDEAQEKARILEAELRRLGLAELMEAYDCQDARASRQGRLGADTDFPTPAQGQPAGVSTSRSCR